MTDWQPMETAPYQTVIEVRNSTMKEPVQATRGYNTEAGVHPDQSFCTSVLTMGEDGLLLMPSGNLICADKWRPVKT